MVSQTVYLFADLYFVGQLGKEAIAAVSLAGNLMMVVLAITQTLGVGTTTLVSHAVGEKDQAPICSKVRFHPTHPVDVKAQIDGISLIGRRMQLVSPMR